MIAQGALEAAGRNWHLVFTSTSIHAIEDAIGAGIAIGVIDRERLKPGMQELGEEAGLPTLERCDAKLHQADKVDANARDAMAALSAMLTEQLTERGPWRHAVS